MKSKQLVSIVGVVMVCLLMTRVALAQTGTQPGTKAPTITHAYAIERGRYGDALRVYIEANDPDKDMLRIAVQVLQTGQGGYPTDWNYLKLENGERFSGYLQWNTFSSRASHIREWTQITMKVSVFDRAGNESNIVVLPFEFVSEVIRRPPLPAPFDQGNLPKLGYIDIELFGLDLHS